MKFLDEKAVRSLLRMEDLLPAMSNALQNLSLGNAVQPVRVIVPVEDHKGFFGVMPAYDQALGAKLVTFYPENRDIHTHQALIVLFKPENGEPIAVMDGRLITEMRTAAVSAVATDLLARKDVESLAILGSGVQARSHLEAMRLVRKFKTIKVWSPSNAARFAKEHNVQAAVSAEDAVRGADVVVIVTSSKAPVLSREWLKPGVHINAVGANRPTWREIDDKTLAVARIFVESKASAVVESGDVIAAGRIDAEIGEIVAGIKDGRRFWDEITLFKSLGAAVEDIAAARIVYERSLATES